jgi:hypothetical protein
MILGTLGILCGVAIATIAGKFPTRRDALERCGGVMTVGGIALVAFAMPFV